MCAHFLLAVEGADDHGALLKDIVRAAQIRYGSHEAFPKGRLTNYCAYTKVDLEARGVIERVPRSSPQRVRLAAHRHRRPDAQPLGG